MNTDPPYCALSHSNAGNTLTPLSGKGDPFQVTAFCSAGSGFGRFYMAGHRAKSQQPVLMSSVGPEIEA